MKPIVDEIAKNLRDSLKEAISDFEGLYVFGSQVRGDAKEGSDIDIVVLFANAKAMESSEYYRIISKIMYDYYGNDLDTQRYTREELGLNPSFYNEVVNKGVFYAAAA